MKKRAFLTSVVILFLLAGNLSPLLAVPIGSSNAGREYLLAAEPLGKWSCGVYSKARKRDVTTGGLSLPMKSRKTMGYVGYDFKRWFTTYATAGSSETMIGGSGYADGESEYGVGMLFNILDHEILDPTLFEDKIRINAGWQYTSSGTKYAGATRKWHELFASLTVSLVNDVEGSKFYLPNSIAIFAGPIYSDIQSSSIDEKDAFGLITGLEVFYSEKISIDWAIERFESSAYTVGINIRF